jgi:shikimate 5-dehydrogenase
MIEVPRAAITAGEIAEVADFFSFGTNDLTQMALGLSRDDAGRFLPEYVQREIYPEDPFVSIDRAGVGELMRLAVTAGRKAKRGSRWASAASTAASPPPFVSVMRSGGLRLLLPVPCSRGAARSSCRCARGLSHPPRRPPLKVGSATADDRGAALPVRPVDRTLASALSPTLFGVLGDPVDHSLSPAMQNAAFAATRLPHVYLRYRVAPQALAAALDEARALGMGGLNLTIPLKEVALGLVDRLTAEAQRIGAVKHDRLRAAGDRLVGDNTDGRGFLASLRGRVRLRGQTAVILGAGGSARAVGTALATSGCARLVVANRTAARGRAAREPARRSRRRSHRVGSARVARAPRPPRRRGAGGQHHAGRARGREPARRAGGTPSHCLFVDLVYGVRPSRFLARATRSPPPHARRRPHAPPPGGARLRGLDRTPRAAGRHGARASRRGPLVD